MQLADDFFRRVTVVRVFNRDKNRNQSIGLPRILGCARNFRRRAVKPLPFAQTKADIAPVCRDAQPREQLLRLPGFQLLDADGRVRYLTN